MRVETITCPNCGASITPDPHRKIVFCPYCDTAIRIEDDGNVDEIKENAQEIGYQFEKGRIRAQEEKQQKQTKAEKAKEFLQRQKLRRQQERDTRQAQDQYQLQCPRCGSTNLKISREKKAAYRSGSSSGGTVRAGRVGIHSGTHSSTINYDYHTVAVCQNCGYAWDPNGEDEKREGSCLGTILTIFAFIFFFPLALTIYLLRDKKADKRITIPVIIAV